MSKLIFLDVDGTLVDYHNRIPESAVKAIRQAREKGHLVYVCTGRSKAEMQPELWEIGLDGMIGGNGSYVEHHGQVLMHELISKEDAAKIVDWLTERHLAFYLESNNGLFASPDFRERALEPMKTYAIQKGQSEESVAGKKTEDFFHGLKFGGELYRNDLNKVSFVLESYQDHLDSKEAFPQLEAHTWGGRGENMSKLIFLDVDGTLVDYHNRIPESAVKAIRQAREKGHLVYVCTGRSKAEMQPELWKIGLDGMIGGNGSYVEHHGQVLMHQLISKEDAAKIVDWLTERHLAFYLESNNGLFASPDFRERARETLKTYAIQKGNLQSLWRVRNQKISFMASSMVGNSIVTT